jgi:hypothetical protein
MAKRTGKHAYLRLRLMALRGLYGRNEQNAHAAMHPDEE